MRVDILAIRPPEGVRPASNNHALNMHHNRTISLGSLGTAAMLMAAVALAPAPASAQATVAGQPGVQATAVNESTFRLHFSLTNAAPAQWSLFISQDMAKAAQKSEKVTE